MTTDDFFVSALSRENDDLRVILTTILEQSPAGIVAVNPAGYLLLINQSAKAILGCSPKQLETTTWADIRKGLEVRTLDSLPLAVEEEPLFLAMRLNKPVTQRVQFISPATGHDRWVNVTALPVNKADGTMIAGVATFLDVTDFKGVQDALYHMATHDPLTGLANRALFSASLVKALARVKRTKQGGAILALDLDNFKHVNDTMGHAAGDELLKKVAERLKSEVRETDVVARIGGDEFNILLLDMEGEDYAESAGAVARRICAALALPFSIWGQEVRITVSIGISFFPSNGLDEEVLLSRVDAAMYQVKERGRNGWRFWAEPIGGIPELPSSEVKGMMFSAE